MAAAAAAASGSSSQRKKGRFVATDGTVYEGEYVIGPGGQPVREGFGRLSDGSSAYEGHWTNDKRNGVGEQRAASGAVYKGDFQDDAFHGTGTYTWPDGSAYSGPWAYNKMHGAGGHYQSVDGVRYVGAFYAGLYCSGKTRIAVR